MSAPYGFKLAGHIGVDAGLCWIGDPCYVIHKTSQQLDERREGFGRDWGEFCDTLGDKDVVSFGGWGIATSTGYGDGEYPVYVRKNSDGRVVEVRVLFDEGGEE